MDDKKYYTQAEVITELKEHMTTDYMDQDKMRVDKATFAKDHGCGPDHLNKIISGVYSIPPRIYTRLGFKKVTMYVKDES